MAAVSSFRLKVKKRFFFHNAKRQSWFAQEKLLDLTGTITETGTSISSMMTYINRWPHIKWLLTIMNHGTASIFTALRNNTGGAKTKFLSEIVRIMQKYPWCAGVDIDLERGGEYENRDAANALFRDIYQTVKSYSASKLVNICLPGMTSVNGSVGGENWCVCPIA